MIQWDDRLLSVCGQVGKAHPPNNFQSQDGIYLEVDEVVSLLQLMAGDDWG